MAPYHQIKTLKTQKQKLSQDLSDALNDLEDALDDLDEANNGIRLLESKNDCLEGRIQDLQMQLEQYQEKNNQNEVLLKEQDDTIAEYLKVINDKDADTNSGQACPTCFKDMKTAIDKDECGWIEFEVCRHRVCLECYCKFIERTQEGFCPALGGTTYLCGICGERSKVEQLLTIRRQL